VTNNIDSITLCELAGGKCYFINAEPAEILLRFPDATIVKRYTNDVMDCGRVLAAIKGEVPGKFMNAQGRDEDLAQYNGERSILE
jgi:hypothetical protein